MSSVVGHALPYMTALITLAANASPSWTSCGFSSEICAKSGSTIETAGSVPARASFQNMSISRRWLIDRSVPCGYRSAVACTLFWRDSIKLGKRPESSAPDSPRRLLPRERISRFKLIRHGGTWW